MKSWASVGRIAGVVLFLLAFGASSRAEAGAVGRTQGAFAVSPTGAATYTIPIWAPRGPNGLQPSMSLTYDSQSGDGPLGVGWSLSGLSSIYRCAQTYAQDAAPAPITLTSSDVFCLDGRRLRLTGGTYGEPSSTYQTEVADFSNVTAYSSAGSGPAYFEVQGRDGRTYEYGNGGGSQVLASGSTAWVWWLDKVSDRAGNTMTISYSNSNGTAVPTRISWTPSSYGSSTYNYTMQLAYGANVPQSSTYGYVAGSAYSNTNLLSSISVQYSGTTVKKYVFTYQQSPTTGRDELTQVEECADAGQTNCLTPTVITYQNGSAGVSLNAGTLNLGNTANWYLAGYDLNGDGYKDLLFQVGTTWYVAFGSPSGYDQPFSTGINTPAYSPGSATLLVGDLLGTGKDEILANNGGTWYCYTWNGSSFPGLPTNAPYDNAATAYALADTNGDGLPDLVSLEPNIGGTSAYVYIRLNASSGGTVAFHGASTAWTSPSDSGYPITNASLRGPDYQHAVPVQRLDFNGDGRDDLVVTIRWNDGADKLHLSAGYQLISQGSTFSGSWYQDPGAYYLNWNDDACTDFIAGSNLNLSACNGTPGSTIPLSVTPLAVIDWDGSGREDFLYDSGGYLYVQPSTGSGLGAPVPTQITYNSAAVYMGADINGDGLDDLVTWVPGSSTLTYNLHNDGDQLPDLLSSITDGYGNYAKPSYVGMVWYTGPVYSNTWQDATYPYWNYLGPLYLVSQVTFNDPSNPPNGTYYQLHYYAGAWMNLQGRGFSGFGSHQIEDSRNGIYYTLDYDRQFPYTGMLTLDDEQIASSAQVISTRNYSLSDTVLESTQDNERYFPYVSSSTAKDYEVGGTENADLIRTQTGSYSYDNYGNVTSASQTATDNDSGSPYDGDSWTTSVTNTPDVNTGEWCLGLLSESQVSYSASNGSPSVTRTREYTPDTTACRYTQITTEPSSNTYEVTEALGYDTFGNIDSDSITGIGMAARQSSANWGTTGQFPMSMTDATGAITQFNYNFSYGLISSETDPNGLTTSWAYGDGFGRLTQETRPDGTYTQYAYDNCTNESGCPLGSNTLEVEHWGYNTDGTDETNGATFFDELERPIVWTEHTLTSGTYSRNELRYDSLGRVAQRAAPCVYSAATTPCSYWTRMSYDILNRLTQSQRPINQNDSTLQTISYAYAGRTTTATDPNGHTKTLIDDVNGWVRHTEDAGGYSIILNYDAAGTKTSVTDSSGNTLWTGTYAYGVAPFLTGETDMDRGDWGYTVDALGERTAWADAKGQHFYETYDALSRPLTRTEPDLFTQWTWGSSATSHNIGRLASVCTGSASACASSYYSEAETYDNKGRLYQRAIAIPSMGTYTYTLQYNATTGYLDTLTYPVSTSGQALQLKYAYQNGILQSITDVLDSPNVTVWQANAQNPAGQITQETLGNGLVTSRAYDAVTRWLSSVQSGPSGGATVQNQSFLYDEVGNVTQRQDNNLGLSENFYYDSDNRLSYSTLNGTQNLSLTYNNMGNIESRTDVAGGAAWTYDPVHLHEVTQAGSSAYAYSYDANGNVSSRQGSSIAWSSYNYPTLINDTATGESVSFYYGPDRNAWLEDTQTSSGTEQAYHVGKLLDIVSSGGVTDFRHYIYAGNEPVAIDSRKSSGTNAFYYLLSDHQGSVSAITNSSGAVVVGESFSAYGNRRNPTNWSGSPSGTDLTTIAGITRHGYTFQSALASMGLNDMVGRVQDAITGRFLSPDPTLQDPSDPQDYNPYSYTVNNPLTYDDPTGFGSCEFVPQTADITAGEVPVAGQDGSAGEVVCESDAPSDPDVCTECVYSPEPQSPPGWPGPSTYPAPGGSPQHAPTRPSPIRPSPPRARPVPQTPSISNSGSSQQQSTLQKIKNWLCNAGNSLQEGSDKLGTASTALEGLGGATTVAGLIGQPEVNPVADAAVASGGAMMAMGGAGNLLATAMQITGGVAQAIGGGGSVGWSNIGNGVASLTAGAVMGWFGGSSMMSGNSVAARAINSAMGRAAAFGGLAADATSAISPGMSPAQAGCGQ